MSIQGFEYPKAGLGNVGNYQISGVPYVTSTIAPIVTNTPNHITFPSVTQAISIHLLTKNEKLRVGFSSNGVKNGNYYLIDSNAQGIPLIELRVRCTDLYLISDNGTVLSASVAASLTGITGYDLGAVYSGSAGIG
jgi:hypothetical protein